MLVYLPLSTRLQTQQSRVRAPFWALVRLLNIRLANIFMQPVHLVPELIIYQECKASTTPPTKF